MTNLIEAYVVRMPDGELWRTWFTKEERQGLSIPEGASWIKLHESPF